MTLPTGESVPQVLTTYRMLGHEMDGRPGNPEARRQITYRMGLVCTLLARLAGLDLKTYVSLYSGVVVGLALYYGGPTPIGWRAAEAVDGTIRKAVRGQGFQRSHGPRVQLMSSERDGGLGHVHVYAHTGAASVMHVFKSMRAQFGAEHGLAMQAGLALRAHALGFVPSVETRTPLDWLPHAAESALNEERGTDAYWLGLMRAGVVPQHTGANAGSGEPLDPEAKAYEPPEDGGGPSIYGRSCRTRCTRRC